VRLILDTNIIRDLGEGRIKPDGLVAAKDDGFSLHLAHVAFLELLDALCSRRFAWAKWLGVRDLVRNLLDQNEPVLSGWSEGLSRFGIIFANGDFGTAELHAETERRRAEWTELLLRADVPEHLEHGVIADVGGHAEVIEIDAQVVHSELLRIKREWVADFDAFFDDLSGKLDAFLRQPNRRVDEVFVSTVPTRFDGMATSAPLPSVRHDAMVRVLALLARRRLQPEESYNAEKRSNDALDCELLRYLAIPAAICTNDGGIHAKLADARSWQAKYVVRSSDLDGPETRALIRTHRWPT
jgi:hypothetical protein